MSDRARRPLAWRHVVVCNGGVNPEGFEMKTALPALLAAAIATAAPAGQTVEAVARLGPDPVTTGGTYTSPGGLSVAVELKNYQGRTAVCGVWAESEYQSGLTRNRGRRVISRGNVTVDGKRAVGGLHFLRKVAPARSYGGLEANCRITDIPWRAGRTVRAHIPRQIVYKDIDEFGSHVIRFRPGGPSAHPDDPKPWD